MAYLAFAEVTEVTGGTSPDVIVAPLPEATISEPNREDAGAVGFSALEWSVVAIARRDGLSTLREPGPVSVAMGALFGGPRNPRLADPRLEALRRLAVLAWHHGYAVPQSAVRDFLAANFSTDQYEMLVSSVSAGRAATRSRRFREA